jgi:hypothetical protein
LAWGNDFMSDRGPISEHQIRFEVPCRLPMIRDNDASTLPSFERVVSTGTINFEIPVRFIDEHL